MTDVATKNTRRGGRGVASVVLRHRSGQLGLAIASLYLIATLAAPVLLRSNPTSDLLYQNLSESLLQPSGEHLLGTDQLGRDVLVRILMGARFTLSIGVLSVLVGLVIGVPLGAWSGWAKGRVDMIVQRIVDIVLAFPSFLLALALVGVLGPGLRNVIISVGIASFPRFVRVVRGSVLTVRERPYVEASRSLGVSPSVIVIRHVLPNSMAPIIVQSTLELGSAILTAAGLGFLGLGVQQPIPEWGSMLGSARDYIFSFPGLITFPGVAIFGVVLAFNLLGDALRDALDPRLRGEL